MSDILIKGLQMPKERKMFVIETDGSVWEQIAGTPYFCTGCKAIELPSHGELVQRSDILRLFDENKLSAREAVMNAPTILEASDE